MLCATREEAGDGVEVAVEGVGGEAPFGGAEAEGVGEGLDLLGVGAGSGNGWGGGWGVGGCGCGGFFLLDAADVEGGGGPGAEGFEVRDGVAGGGLTGGFFGGEGGIEGAEDLGRRGGFGGLDRDLAGEESTAGLVLVVDVGGLGLTHGTLEFWSCVSQDFISLARKVNVPSSWPV